MLTFKQATKYKNEVEYLYSFVQIITACTASFAHGANDVGNAVGVWAGMYGAWRTGETVASKAEVPLWQIAVMALTICFGFITYGYVSCFLLSLLVWQSSNRAFRTS